MQAAIEVVRYKDVGEGNLQVQLAVKGVLAPMIDDHKSNRERFASEEDYLRHMAKQSEVLIHLYGDARNPLPLELTQQRQEEGF